MPNKSSEDCAARLVLVVFLVSARMSVICSGPLFFILTGFALSLLGIEASSATAAIGTKAITPFHGPTLKDSEMNASKGDAAVSVKVLKRWARRLGPVVRGRVTGM